jgi:hypothetical protein
MAAERRPGARPAICERRGRSPIRRILLAVLVTVPLLSACTAVLESSPEPTPMDFPGIAGELANRGMVLDAIKSGDDGCHDPTLTATAIGFDASGLGVEEPIRLRVYIFRDGATFDRRRADVDTCAAAYAVDPASFVFVDARPFVLTGEGPWPDAFASAVLEALRVAAGNGG